jgi:hypothetical protein
MVEIAERLGVQRTTVERWRQRNLGFPEPSMVVSGTPIWPWPKVLAWFQARGRTTDTRRTPERTSVTPMVRHATRHEVQPIPKGKP